MINFGTVSTKVFRVLKGHGYNIKMYTSEGVETVDSEEARWFFVKDPNMMVVVDDKDDEIKINKNSTLPLAAYESALKQVKAVATHYILNFTIRNFAKTVEPKQFSYQAKKQKKENEKMNEITESFVSESVSFEVQSDSGNEVANSPEEALRMASKHIYVSDAPRHLADLRDGKRASIGYGFNKVFIVPINESAFSKMRGSVKTSIQALEGVKLIVKHAKPVSEEVRGSRSRNIKSIFIENNGQRTQFKYNNLNGARAMARHIQNGGSYGDAISEHILKVTGDVVRLNEFHHYAKANKLINEQTGEVIELVRENIRQCVSELKSFAGSSTYFSAKGVFEEVGQLIQEGDGDVDSLKDMFTVKQFNEKFDEILPLLDGMMTMNRNKMIRVQESSAMPILCVGSPLVENSVVEYASKSAKLGNNLSSLSSTIVGNRELVEFLSVVSQKLIMEKKLSTFENEVVTNVIKNVYTDKKGKKKAKKDIIESYVDDLKLRFSKFEYHTLMEGMMTGESDEQLYEDEVDAEVEAQELRKMGIRIKAVSDKMAALGLTETSLSESCLREYRYAGSQTTLTPSYIRKLIQARTELRQQYVAACRGWGISNKFKRSKDPELFAKYKGRLKRNREMIDSTLTKVERAINNLEAD